MLVQDPVTFIMLSFALAHCLADYSLQGDFIANTKGSNGFIMGVHCLIWSAMIYLVGELIIGGATYLDWAILYAGHYAIDTWKCRRKDKSKALTTYLYIDQFLHAVQIGYFIHSLYRRL